MVRGCSSFGSHLHSPILNQSYSQALIFTYRGSAHQRLCCIMPSETVKNHYDYKQGCHRTGFKNKNNQKTRKRHICNK